MRSRLIVSEGGETGLGGVATLVALIAATIGSIRYWADLGQVWGWIALGVGAFACGMALVRLITGCLRELGDLLGALGALVLGVAAIAAMLVPLPIAPAIGFGVWAAGWIAALALMES